MIQIEFPGRRDRVRACIPDVVVRGEDQCVDGRGSRDRPRSWPNGALTDGLVDELVCAVELCGCGGGVGGVVRLCVCAACA
ncbi:MAG: hypothetical protein ACR2G2_02735, partial [Pseudonocardia sp.]